MKKINIIHYKMVVGGIETSLINLVHFLSKDYDVKVYTLFPGVWDSRLECDCENLLSEKEEAVFEANIKKTRKNLIDAIKTVFLGVKYLSGSLARRISKKIRQADINLCYLPSRICIDITQYLNGMKLCFIHGDVNFVELSKWKLKKLKNYDRIIAVSKSCMNNISAKYPLLKNKLSYLYNLQNIQEIIDKSEMFNMDYDKSKVNIISVSRLSEEKGYIRSLEQFKKLKDEGLNFCWHIIGDGNEMNEIKKFIMDNKLEDYVKLYGRKDNPYPYIKNADLLYLGSFHESFGICLIEAMLLGVPVLTTETCSAKEIVGDFGFICKNNKESIYDWLKTILSSPESLNQKKEILKNYKYGNMKIINDLSCLIDELSKNGN